MKPIKLTADGDYLLEYPGSNSTDESSLSCCTGIHQYCNGWVDRIRVTEEKDALVCRKCHIQIRFSNKIKNFGELRKYLIEKGD